MLGEWLCEIFSGIVVTPHECAIESTSLGLSIARSITLTSVLLRELRGVKAGPLKHSE